MNLLNKLTIQNLKLNKKRTIVTVIGILLSVALITAVASMYSSGIASLIAFETYQMGNFHAAFFEVPVSEIDSFRKNSNIEEVFFTQNLGYAKLDGVQNEYKPYAFVEALPQASLENLSIKLVEGRFPENDSELLIPTHLKTNGRLTLHVGDTITLEIGDRIASDGSRLTQHNPYSSDEFSEQLVHTAPHTYTIVGMMERPASNMEDYSAPGYTFITYQEENDITGNVDLYVNYTSAGTKNAYRETAAILGIDGTVFEAFQQADYPSKDLRDAYSSEMSKAKYDIAINSYLIDLENNPLEVSSISDLGYVVLVVCLIIVFTSVFCIKNSFDISITEKTKQYGMLRSAGATKKQIRHNVFFEASILGAIGIPLGIFGGLLASYILIFVCNYFLGDFLGNGISLVFGFSWIAILFSILLGIVTIYFSAFRSARKASKVSPIDSIRNHNDIKLNAKKVKSPKWIKRIFGIGGEISYKNLKRNKKKYRTTVISIIVSVSVFIALYSFMELAFDSISKELNLSDYNVTFTVWMEDVSSVYERLLQTTTLDDIENFTIKRTSNLTIESAKYSDEYKKIIPDGYLSTSCSIPVVCLGETPYRKYVASLGLDYDTIKDKGILLDYAPLGTYHEESNDYSYEYARIYDYSAGEMISGVLKGEQPSTIEIGYVTDVKPFGFANETNAKLIVSDEWFNDYTTSSSFEIYYLSNQPDKLQDTIEKLDVLKNTDGNFSINNISESVTMINHLFTLLAIFLYGFITVITLIGITNIFNTITTNIQLRRQEFAMLKSIGMTTSEFNRMIRLESFFMGVKSLLFGIPLGVGLSYLTYQFFLASAGIKYGFPVVAIILASAAVFLLITLLMRYSIGKIHKQNIIETIRNENI